MCAIILPNGCFKVKPFSLRSDLWDLSSLPRIRVESGSYFFSSLAAQNPTPLHLARTGSQSASPTEINVDQNGSGVILQREDIMGSVRAVLLWRAPDGDTPFEFGWLSCPAEMLA